jgi:hypothetical protein
MALPSIIERLKVKYPRSEKFIESEYQRFLSDDSQHNEGDFYNFLVRDVEQRNPPEFKSKGLPKRPGPRR